MKNPKANNGFDPEAFRKAAQSGKTNEYINSNLDPETAGKLQSILKDKSQIEKIMQSPVAQALLKKFGEGK